MTSTGARSSGRSSSASCAKASTSISVKYLEGIEHAIGTIDNGDNTRPAARYFIPYLVSAYQARW